MLPTSPSDDVEIDSLAKLNSVVYLFNRAAHDCRNEVELLNKALAVMNTFPKRLRVTAYYQTNLGNILLSLGDVENAESALKKSVSRAKTPGGLAGLGAVYRRLGRHKEALQYCEMALEISPTHRSARAGKAVALYELRRYVEAIPILTDLVRESP